MELYSFDMPASKTVVTVEFEAVTIAEKFNIATGDLYNATAFTATVDAGRRGRSW